STRCAICWARCSSPRRARWASPTPGIRCWPTWTRRWYPSPPGRGRRGHRTPRCPGRTSWNGSPRRGGTPWSCPHTPPTCRPRASTPSACCSPRRPTMTTDLAGRGTGAGPGSGAGTGSGPGTGTGTTTGTATGTGTAPGTVTGTGTAPAAGSGRGRPPADRPRDAACQRFAGELRRALADVPPAAADRPLPEVAVRALGVEDAFGAPAGQPSDGRAAPAGAVPVHLYGHHVIVGPW